jgi:hypothetical protein
MTHLAEVCSPGCKEGQARRRRRSVVRRPGRADRRRLAETMLREMAFVLQATRSIRESMAEEPSKMETPISPEDDLVPCF